ncbi:MATE family efflux transporter [Bacillus cytotoxicus]|uniref:Probable multidrug resistance protein NorM n=1 Tax=Bacillus cytotoxicus (strain DSM 22905 / CIP 110041 / 391-98 / NVH 391-98) TaxID=315749 RepID=A7GMS7_BACCN|nr:MULTISPECIES: MATE family efflux transporter [Bacillus cereus group]ABS21435.1 MATE efflux family protein [Bacillus cytotoxicus NVH 391-98]AWC28076.1 MATE family efflux transporter [Bacillus cytotoxicus]AWC32111.1 MATE family efflux transporter [Bacillus cytotoxicus]AWC36138.1 MATE family efflux transporter [Bacillus cytotoxicus]AWC40542.1 MATE family efflux transporter [Bacillus cytotoxicus]
MNEALSFSQKIKQFLLLFLPIFVTQMSLFAMSFFDTTMSGHASPTDLAGVAIGTSIWIPVSTGLTGILMATTPIVAQLVGSNKKEDVPHIIIQAVYLAIFVSILVIIIGFFAVSPILSGMQLEESVERIAAQFLSIIAIGIIPLFVYTVLRGFIDALGKTRTTMIITLLSLPINVVLNYVLIFGHFGFPKFGGVGAAIASTATYWCILLITIMIICTKEPFASFGIFKQLYRVSFSSWKEFLKLGVPIGFAIFFETSIFAAVTLLMSNFSTTTIAAHQAAMNFASLLYMTPLSLSMAMTIAVGFEVGAKRYRNAKQYGWIGIGFALAFALFYSILLYFFDDAIASIYTTDLAVHHLAKEFLIFAILFQFSDAIATPVQGALRGYKDVNVALIMTLIAYWVIGLPLGYFFATYTDWAAKGYWIGLILGLAFGASFLLVRLFQVQRKYITEKNR